MALERSAAITPSFVRPLAARPCRGPLPGCDENQHHLLPGSHGWEERDRGVRPVTGGGSSGRAQLLDSLPAPCYKGNGKEVSRTPPLLRAPAVPAAQGLTLFPGQAADPSPALPIPSPSLPSPECPRSGGSGTGCRSPPQRHRPPTPFLKPAPATPRGRAKSQPTGYRRLAGSYDPRVILPPRHPTASSVYLGSLPSLA